MKVLLVNPPLIYFPGSTRVLPGLPLGLLYVAAVLEKRGYHEVEILDTLTEGSGPSGSEGVIHYGMAWDEIREEIARRRPDVVGITSPYTTQIDNAVKIAGIVKQIDKKILTIVGGPHASVRPVEVLKDASDIDIAVIGEGEYTMPEILEYYLGKKNIDEIPGIAYRKDGEIVLGPYREFIKDLDALPFPAYHLVDMEKYLDPRGARYRGTRYLREISMITSRGCPFNCVFCSIHLHMGRTWRAHSSEYVVAHIEHVINKYGVRHIHFEDDNLTLNARRFTGILDGVIGKGLRFIWDTPNGIRADGLTVELLRKMKATGCVNLSIGIESGDQDILDNVIDKKLRLDDAIRAIEMCHQAGIKMNAFYVIGFPGERPGNMERTVELALRLKKQYDVDMSLMVATPLYGTRLHDLCLENGYLTRELTPRALSEGTQAYGRGLISTPDFTPEDVKKLALRAISRYNRLSLLTFIRRPWGVLRTAVKNPAEAWRFIRNAIGI
jgi:magnesium-protoporphyrin IX monomethyl ester (oxidative) cyclase